MANATSTHECNIFYATSPRLRVVSASKHNPQDPNASCSLLLTCKNADQTHSTVSYLIELRGSWSATTNVNTNDIIRVVLTRTETLSNNRDNRDNNNISNKMIFLPWKDSAVYDPMLSIVFVQVCDEENLVVQHPDMLISGSEIAESYSCLRRTVLRVRNPSTAAHRSISEPAFYGTLIHSLFQFMIVSLSDNPELGIDVFRSAPHHILSTQQTANTAASMLALDIPLSTVHDVLHNTVQPIHKWFTSYHARNGNDDGLPPHPPPRQRPRIMYTRQFTTRDISITRVRDIEELAWSPSTGLKGNIDATVQIRLPTTDGGGGYSERIAVCELKTGATRHTHALNAHHAQVSLYKLLLSDRYNTGQAEGIVAYIPSPHRNRKENNKNNYTTISTSTFHMPGGRGRGRGRDGNDVDTDHERRFPPRRRHIQRSHGDCRAGPIALATFSSTESAYTPLSSAAEGLRPRRRLSLPRTTSTATTGTIPDDRYVHTDHREISALVQRRNEIACKTIATSSTGYLPAVLQGKQKVCANCAVRKLCAVENKTLEEDSELSIPRLGDLFDQALYQRETEHITPIHARYYRFWRAVLDMERAKCEESLSRLWVLRGHERATMDGGCIPDLRLVSSQAIQSPPPPPPPNSTHSQPGSSTAPTQATWHILQRSERKYAVSFQRHHYHNRVVQYPPTNISVGDNVIVSVERMQNNHNDGSTATWKPAVCTALVIAIGGGGGGGGGGVGNNDNDESAEGSVEVWTTRNLSEWATTQVHGTTNISHFVWRIDIASNDVKLRASKSNLIALFTSPDTTEDDEHRVKWRKVILNDDDDDDGTMGQSRISESEASRTTTTSTTTPYTLNKIVAPFARTLNEDQRTVLHRFTQLPCLTLVHGMPGTGKTHTLAALALCAIERGQTVLVCAHTHSAVDNILLKLVQANFHDFIRVARTQDVRDPQLHPYVVDVYSKAYTRDTLEAAITSSRVVGATCVSLATNVLFSIRRSEDVVLVDEAAQIVHPLCIGAFLHARKQIVLVGDPQQLPPLMHYTNTDNATLQRTLSQQLGGEFNISDFKERSVSLFEWLCNQHPNSITRLSTQYRMSSDIMYLCNHLIYNNTLQCATRVVAEQRLLLNPTHTWGGLRMETPATVLPWVEYTLNPSNRLVFVDIGSHQQLTAAATAAATTTAGTTKTAGRSTTRTRDHTKKNQSEVEAVTVMRLVRALIVHGVQASSITILTPFHAQRKLLGTLLSQAEHGPALRTQLHLVTISTIDQYQGRENDCVIVSFVVCNDTESSGSMLLCDARRVNVAITRARKKLILIGSESSLLLESDFLRSMIRTVQHCTVRMQ